MNEPGPLLASGRDSDIFEFGPGLVLRRSRLGRSMAGEAQIMEYARAQGYPVPAVGELRADGTEVVMERIEGPSMLDYLTRRVWTVGRQGHVLGTLHERLHQIDGPEWLDRAGVGQGDRLVHMDLHPGNVIVSPKGPVVIDWPNARRGDPSIDVALTWVLVASGEVPSGPVLRALSGAARRRLLAGLFAEVDRTAAAAKLRDAVGWKVQDPNMSHVEQAHMWDLVARTESETRADTGAGS